MDALLSTILLLSTLLVSAFLILTGKSRFTSGRASGFTPLGAPHVGFPLSAALGVGEVLLGIGLLVLPSPGSMVAAYLALLGLIVYTWRAARSLRPADERRQGDITGAGLGTIITLCGISVVAIADSIALTPALFRLADPANLAWIGALGLGAASVRWLRHHRVDALLHAIAGR